VRHTEAILGEAIDREGNDVVLHGENVAESAPKLHMSHG
jgi:hypothetical protein